MFKPQCLPILIGSLPLSDHHEAMELILTYSPAIPLWPQLPLRNGEGMIRQFLSGFPGLQEEKNRYWIDTSRSDFEEQMASFYEDYMEVEQNGIFPEGSRFSLGSDTAPGFAAFLEKIATVETEYITLKGQVTGPVTTGIGVKDQHGKSIIYDDNLRDVLVKHLTFKAIWQINTLRNILGCDQPILFIDEPGIVSFGSSAFSGISREMVSDAVTQTVTGIQNSGGLAGIHICANGDWGPALTSPADIISFDAYFYFDNFILYRDQLIEFLQRGGILAWGIIPTADPALLEEIHIDTLLKKWLGQVETLAHFGFSRNTLLEQILIAPSCGTGSLPPNLAMKVLQLTAELSEKVRNL
ncbi:MAG: hypothetical protein V2I36_16860 [Desulfopila sp.]|nr:hypothetical protein [Desulfopila sp.]